MLHYRPTDKQDAITNSKKESHHSTFTWRRRCLPARPSSLPWHYISVLTHRSPGKDTNGRFTNKNCNEIRQQEWRHILQYGRLQTVVPQTNVAFVATNSVAIFASSTCLNIFIIFIKFVTKQMFKFSTEHTNCQRHVQKSLNFTIVWPCIVTNFFVIKPTRSTNITNLFWRETLHVLGSSSVHQQEFIHCTLSNDIYHCWVYSE